MIPSLFEIDTGPYAIALYAGGLLFMTTQFLPRPLKQGERDPRDRGTTYLFWPPFFGLALVALRPYLLGGLPHPLLAVAGGTLTLLGVALLHAARLKLGRFYTVRVNIREGHRLVTDGIYAFVRHPRYAGFLLAGLGIPMIAGSVLGVLVFTIPLWVATLVRLRVEEEVLFEVFGEEYRAYAARTKRVFPGVW
ncbi:MAG TPA: isoprenylcysteine carboxylmethyltransferase family protein [Planctomycetota bacterium]|nr:isoprenylcysteine carboxylmethyltransferase family protein [Planctomycetota bacterium]